MRSTATDCILVINAGSSSVKFRMFSCEPKLNLLAGGKVYDLGSNPSFAVTNETARSHGKHVDKKTLPADSTHENALRLILDWIEAQSQDWQVIAVAHRVVHGGVIFTKSVKITPDVIEQLHELSSLAPLHQSHNLAAIAIINKIKPGVQQVACFDTAFHSTHTDLFTNYALPQSMRDEGIRRFGFHGLSYEWIVHDLKHHDPILLEGRIIAAHLGSGASLCAIQKGVSIDSTMGMTALDGLPMGTRCGNLDPGAVIYMMRNLGLSVEKIEHIFYNESGLLGLSGTSNDVKILETSDDQKAQFALDYFCLRAAQLMGMMAVALGGVDGIVFTGGIGENSVFVRENILSHLDFLKPFKTCIIPANEERIMAMHTLSILE
jgi:acetate kinase